MKKKPIKKNQVNTKTPTDNKNTYHPSTKMTTNGRVFIISVVGGFFWGSIWLLCYFLHFTKVSPMILLSFVKKAKWVQTWQGMIVSILIFMAVSIVIGFIYKYVLGEIKSIWMSIGFGGALFVGAFYIIEPWVADLPPINKLGWDTVVTMLCLSVLYGLFIGYSISFDIRGSSHPQNYSNN